MPQQTKAELLASCMTSLITLLCMRCAARLRVACILSSCILSSCTARCRSICCSAMFVYVCTYFSVVQGHNWLWRVCMQQWYEFTTTKGTAWVLMYINITITAKGAELSGTDSWEGVSSCKIGLWKSIKARLFNLTFYSMPESIDTLIWFWELQRCLQRLLSCPTRTFTMH